MGLRINQNITALNAHRNLVGTDSALSKSLERLSSGLRINRAADDAAGLAISEKMRTQIKGLAQAARNAQDAISLIQTAEGALNETHSILQRMRQLAVQAANDTLTAEDRQQIQQEIDQLIQELDRIGNTTEFNTKKLLNGRAGYRVSAKGGTAVAATVTIGTTAYGGGSSISDTDLEKVVTNLTPGTNTKAGV
ncbi:MAG: flagellin, partial [Candidatus Atribacteria bacterium]|nr:flagellin [Candidatus Atribacteria bacterium]